MRCISLPFSLCRSGHETIQYVRTKYALDRNVAGSGSAKDSYFLLHYLYLAHIVQHMLHLAMGRGPDGGNDVTMAPAESAGCDDPDDDRAYELLLDMVGQCVAVHWARYERIMHMYELSRQ